jgi:hypothetical protein
VRLRRPSRPKMLGQHAQRTRCASSSARGWLRDDKAPRSPDVNPAATWRRKEVHGSNAEFSSEPDEPMDREVLKPAL